MLFEGGHLQPVAQVSSEPAQEGSEYHFFSWTSESCATTSRVDCSNSRSEPVNKVSHSAKIALALSKSPAVAQAVARVLAADQSSEPLNLIARSASWTARSGSAIELSGQVA